MSDTIDNLVQEGSNRSLAPTAVGSQVLLMLAVSGATIVAFNLLRPKNKMIYEPKTKYHVGKEKPPPISNSVFGWISPLLHWHEPELVEKIGLDAVTFLRFLRLFRWLFTAIAVMASAALIPTNLVYNLKYVDKDDRPDILTMMTIRDLDGTNFLFVHVAVMYAITGTVMGFIWVHWKRMVRLRQAWFRSPEYQQSFYARTLLILRVPKSLQSDEGIHSIFESVQVPYPTTSVHVGRRVGRLPELIEYHNETVRELEKILVRYLKGGRIRKERPTIRQGGVMCCGGTKKDAIDFYTMKLKRTEAAVEEYRHHIDSRKPENYGFASMAAVPYAHIVANMLRHKRPRGTIVTLAPNPKDIIWKNITKSPSEITRLSVTGFVLLAFVCFMNTAPLFFISILANLASISTYVPFLQSWASSSKTTFAIVSGVLPPAVSSVFGYFLPIVMRWLTRYMGAHTHSRLDRAVVARYFAFLVISQLVIFTLIGVLFQSIEKIVQQIGQHKSFSEIISNLDKLPSTINQTYIDQSSYWLTFFPLRGFLTLFDLAQVINLLWTSFKTHVFGRTPRDIREWTQPPHFQYAIYYSNILFMGTVGMVFAPLAPLVAVGAAIVFWTSSWVYKYQLMYVFVTKVETGGRLWNPVMNRIIASTVLMQLLFTLTMILQMGFKTFKWVVTIPPILATLFFKYYLNRTFDRQFRFYIPSDEELRVAKVHSQKADMSGNRLEKRFGHPALHAELFTPMLHAKMMPLLRDVYSGKISNDKSHLGEYGGQEMETQVMPGGIRIAGIDQSHLAYDPTLYQRDRGELDWDARSMASTNIFGDAVSLHAAKSQYYANSRSGRASPAPTMVAPMAYNQYMVHGPSNLREDIEMARFDVNPDQQPLLMAPQAPGYFDPSASSLTLGGGSTPPIAPVSQHPQYPPGMSQYDSYRQAAATPPLPQYPQYPMHQHSPGEGYRQAPLHRPYPPSREPSGYSVSSSPAPPPPPSDGNMAGRGAFGRGGS